jgi:GTP pyrophosphokinase
MHLQAEFGILAHWRYKAGYCFRYVLEMVEWDRWVVTWQREILHMDHPSSLATDTLASDMHTNPSHSDVCLHVFKPVSQIASPEHR